MLTSIQRFKLIRFMTLALAVGAIGTGLARESHAQPPRRNEIQIPPIFSGEEQSSQHDLWVMEVYIKPMRMIPVELTDPKTGEKKLEWVWYIVYRAIPRKLRDRSDPKAPVNEFDAPVGEPLFIPELTIVVNDNNKSEIYQDQVIPEALVAINKREKSNHKSSVSAVEPIPEAVEPGGGNDTAISGVAMWRGVDPDADRYTVFMTGFSNGFRKTEGSDGEPVVLHKTIVQKFIRRGDRYNLSEAEIKPDGDAVWIYR